MKEKFITSIKNLWNNATPLGKLLIVIMLLLFIYNLIDFVKGGKGNIFYQVKIIFVKPTPEVKVEEMQPPQPPPVEIEKEDLRESVEDIPTTTLQPQTPIPQENKKNEEKVDIEIEELTKLIDSSSEEKVLPEKEKKYTKWDPYEPVIRKIRKKEKPRQIEKITDLLPLPIPDSPLEEEYHLRGVIIDRNPVAIIESEKKEYVVNKGDKVDEWTVVFISSNKVVLKCGPIRKELFFE